MLDLKTYVVPMICANCGLLNNCEIRVRREIVPFERWYDAEEVLSETFSQTRRIDGSDVQPLCCTRCGLAQLKQAFYAGGNMPVFVGGGMQNA